MTRTRVAFAIPTLSRGGSGDPNISRGGAGEMQGGPEGVFTTLLQRIDHERFDVHLLVDDRTASNLLDALDHRVTVSTLDDFGTPLPHRTLRRYPIRRFAKAVRSLQPDVVLTTLRVNITAALAKPLFPDDTALVCRVANNVTGALATVEQTNSKIRQRAVERLHRLVQERADLVIAQSTAMEHDLLRRFGPDAASKIRQVPNPVDVDGLLARAQQAPASYPGGDPLLVSVGRLHHQKGYDLLLPAFAQVLAHRPGARLRIFGEGPDRERLEAQAADLGIAERVDLPGFVDDPAPYVAQADLYVCSSRYEGFSNALAEALAVGTPAVAPDGPAAGRDLLTSDNGVLIDEPTAATLADAIERALATTFDRDAISRDCRERFAPEIVVARYEEVLLEATRRHRAPLTS